ncbi:unnamed protein product [Polarella glacialis]|uniref:BTB domain-containing protein n=1 Tax=Polarella glacialis TaxID=89957 RepID=A0A813JLM3_POLGL|nr:unnamed protein product [Polarella glacialis]
MSTSEVLPMSGDKSRLARLHFGLRPKRLALDEARPLRALVQNMLRCRLVPRDARLLESLPIFETQGGHFAVPLAPASARIMPPDEDWDEALQADFADYLLSWKGEAGELLTELGRERSSPAAFLAEFCAPRAGLFNQHLSIRFLETVATLGAAPWKRPGAPKDCATIAQSCEDAPVVVFPVSKLEEDAGVPNRRCRCSELADPGDAALSRILGAAAIFPPEAYQTPLVLSVMRRAGLRSLADEAVFLQAASAAEASGGEMGGALLRHLADRWDSLKWPSKAYSSLSKLRIFPAIAFSVSNDLYPPSAPPQPTAPVASAVALDAPCTLFHHADVSWTQLVLLDPRVFDSWPKQLLQRFGALKDPPPLETVVANLIEVARRWGADSSPAEATATEQRQTIIRKHLIAVQALSKRSHATLIMVQHSLASTKFLVLDDGTLTRPCDVFQALHGGDSDSEGEEAPGANSTRRAAKKSRAAAGPWVLPRYLRPFRRILLGIAGPAVGHARSTPSLLVGPAPPASCVPDFIRAALNVPELADVEFVLRPCEDGPRSLYAHRLVLAASCEHFHAMFTSGCAEAVGIGGRCRLDLPDWVAPRPMLWMLAYLYQGFDPKKAQEVAFALTPGLGPGPGRSSAAGRRPGPRFAEGDAGEDLCCLLRLSEFYDLEHLKQWTEQRLQGLMTPENLVALSTHAYFCNASQLLRLCVYHLQQLYSELVGVEEWEELEPAIKELVLLDTGTLDT